MEWTWIFALLALFVFVAACEDRGSVAAKPRAARYGDPGRGAELVEKLECARCHASTGQDEATASTDCRGCHRRIESGRFPVGWGTLARWQARIRHFVDVPSLAGTTERFRRSWVARLLREPSDLRPRLDETMPRFGLTDAQADDLAEYLAPDDDAAVPAPHADAARGRRWMDTLGCGTCHRFTGVPPLAPSAISVPIEPDRLALAMKLAPDLRFARERLLPGVIEKWLARPSDSWSSALMPSFELSPTQARDVAAYVLSAPLAPATAPPIPARLPVLDRPVTWDEVNRAVFHDTCWHCHSDPDFAHGDGGPGNTGGFGFRGRGIDLGGYEQTQAGALDAQGERRSLFESPSAGEPGLLLRALLARASEVAGRPVPGVRGMPLALPPLSPEKIQLVETWVAQGRPE